MRRIGRFRISQYYMDTKPDEVAEVLHLLGLNKVYVSRQYDFVKHEYVYKGCSDYFDELQPDEPVPEYLITLHKERDEPMTIKNVERLDDSY